MGALGLKTLGKERLKSGLNKGMLEFLWQKPAGMGTSGSELKQVEMCIF